MNDHMIRRRPLWAMALILVLLGLVWAGNSELPWLDSTPTAGEGSGDGAGEGGGGGGDPPPPAAALSDALLTPADLADLAPGWTALPGATPLNSSEFCDKDSNGKREKFNHGRTPLESVKASLANPPGHEIVGQQLQRFDTGDGNQVFNSFNSLKARCRKWFSVQETAADGPVRKGRTERRERQWNIEDFDPAFPTYGDETIAFRIVTQLPKKQGTTEVTEAPLEAHFILIRRGDVVNLVSYVVSEGGIDRADAEMIAQRADAKLAAFLTPPPPPPPPPAP